MRDKKTEKKVSKEKRGQRYSRARPLTLLGQADKTREKRSREKRNRGYKRRGEEKGGRFYDDWGVVEKK